MARFLYIGDQALVSRLQLPGFEVVSATGSTQALALLGQEDFAFVLLDAAQPEVSALIGMGPPLLVLATPAYEPWLYQHFVQRQIFDLVDPLGLPASLEKSLVLLGDPPRSLEAAERFSLTELTSLKNKALSHLYHQLQGPVTALEGYLEILRSDQLSAESIDQILAQLSHCVVRLRFYFLSLHLLSLVSAEVYVLKPRPFQFHQLIREFQRDFKQQMALSEVAWDYQLDAQEDLVLADPYFLLHLFSVVMNLAQRTGLQKGRVVSLQTNNLSAERLAARSEMSLDPAQSLSSFLPEIRPENYLQVTFQFRGSGPELSRVLLAEHQSESWAETEDPEIVLGAYLLTKILQASQSWLYVESQPGFGLLLSFVLPLHSLPEVKS